MMVSAHDQPVRQLEMGHVLLLGFSTTLLLKAEKSLDLLQAMLVYNAWFVYPGPVLNAEINIYHARCVS